MVGDRYQAKVITGQAVGAVYPIYKTEVIIGRNPVADIPAQEGDVSRRHAVIFRLNDEVHLRDEGSTNGTFLNGQRVTDPVLLKVGDKIRLGSRETLVIELEPFNPTIKENTSQKPSQSSLAAIEAARREDPGRLPRNQRLTEKKQGKSGKGANLWWILFLLAGSILCLAAFLFFWYIDTNFLWCWIVPVLPACP